MLGSLATKLRNPAANGLVLPLLLAAPIVLTFAQTYMSVAGLAKVTFSDLAFVLLLLVFVGAVVSKRVRLSATRLGIPFLLVIAVTLMAVAAERSIQPTTALRELLQLARDISLVYIYYLFLRERPRLAPALLLVLAGGTVFVALVGGGTVAASVLVDSTHGPYERPGFLVGFAQFNQFMNVGLIGILAALAAFLRRPSRFIFTFGLAAVLLGVILAYARGGWLTALLIVTVFLLLPEVRSRVALPLVTATVAGALVLGALPGVASALTVRITNVDLTGERYASPSPVPASSAAPLPAPAPAPTATPRPYNSEYTRVILWRTGLAMVAASPIFGHGPGNYVETMRGYLPADSPVPPEVFLLGDVHNDLIQVAVDAGLLGLAAHLILIGSVFSLGLSILRRRQRLRGAALFVGLAAAAYCIVWPITEVYQTLTAGYVVRALFLALALLAHDWTRSDALAVEVASNAPAQPAHA